jgi:superfamily I DNA/RNA helicase
MPFSDTLLIKSVSILGSHKFFDRVEIKDVLAHLIIIGNSKYLPAWNRCLQRVEGIGEKVCDSVEACEPPF